MLKSCSYCGRIHDVKLICPPKEKAIARQEDIKNHARKDRGDRADKFRHTGAWKKMREHILHRDRRLCLCCLAGIDGGQQFTTDNLSVHHIVPLREDYDKRLDEGNLITLCDYHHERCEDGTVERAVQFELVEKAMNGTILAEYQKRGGEQGRK